MAPRVNQIDLQGHAATGIPIQRCNLSATPERRDKLRSHAERGNEDLEDQGKTHSPKKTPIIRCCASRI
jgi:hypothetical protein